VNLVLLFGVYLARLILLKFFYVDVSVRFRPLQVYLSCDQIFLLAAQLLVSLEACHFVGFFQTFFLLYYN